MKDINKQAHTHTHTHIHHNNYNILLLFHNNPQPSIAIHMNPILIGHHKISIINMIQLIIIITLMSLTMTMMLILPAHMWRGYPMLLPLSYHPNSRKVSVNVRAMPSIHLYPDHLLICLYPGPLLLSNKP